MPAEHCAQLNPSMAYCLTERTGMPSARPPSILSLVDEVLLCDDNERHHVLVVQRIKDLLTLASGPHKPHDL